MTIQFVYITAGSLEEAKTIGRTLVTERLTACVNIIDNMLCLVSCGMIHDSNICFLFCEHLGRCSPNTSRPPCNKSNFFFQGEHYFITLSRSLSLEPVYYLCLDQR